MEREKKNRTSGGPRSGAHALPVGGRWFVFLFTTSREHEDEVTVGGTAAAAARQSGASHTCPVPYVGRPPGRTSSSLCTHARTYIIWKYSGTPAPASTAKRRLRFTYVTKKKKRERINRKIARYFTGIIILLFRWQNENVSINRKLGRYGWDRSVTKRQRVLVGALFLRKDISGIRSPTGFNYSFNIN